MSVSLRTAALGTLLAAWFAPGVAVAQSGANALYVSLGALYVMPSDGDSSHTVGANRARYDMTRDDDFGLSVALGYGAPTGPRGELEFTYRNTDSHEARNVTFGALAVPGNHAFTSELETLSLMANGYYAFEAGPVRPYLGAGVGIARHALDYPAQSVEFEFGGMTHPVEFDDTSENDTAAAWQLMAGVGYALSDSAELRLGYRYLRTGDVDLGSVETTYAAHNVEAGVAFRF